MRTLMVALVLVLWALAPAALPEATNDGPTYEVADIKGKLKREAPLPEMRLEVGEAVEAGAVVRTGWWSSAEISCPSHASLFAIGPRTRVQLASEAPGVLVDVKKGRLRAVFDKVSGEIPVERLVTTPSAVLAVRGTEYGVTVDAKGATTIVVFSGVVDVQDRNRNTETVRVRKGMYATIEKGQGSSEPMPHTMTGGDFDRGSAPQDMGRGGSSQMENPGMSHGSSRPNTAGSDGSSGSSGSGRRR